MQGIQLGCREQMEGLVQGYTAELAEAPCTGCMFTDLMDCLFELKNMLNNGAHEASLGPAVMASIGIAIVCQQAAFFRVIGTHVPASRRVQSSIPLPDYITGDVVQLSNGMISSSDLSKELAETLTLFNDPNHMKTLSPNQVAMLSVKIIYLQEALLAFYYMPSVPCGSCSCGSG